LHEDTDDEDEQKLSGAGKQMRKMLKKNDKSGQYDDSDEDKNPYASSVCHRSSFRFWEVLTYMRIGGGGGRT